MYSAQFCFDETLAKRQLIPTSLPDNTIDQLLLTPYNVFTDLTNDQLESLAQRAAYITTTIWECDAFFCTFVFVQ